MIIMKQTVQLSDLDRRILSEVQRDANLSAAELAERTESSPATCWRRLRALEEAGVIGTSVRLVDPVAVGRTLEAFCSVRLTSQDEVTRRSFQRMVNLEESILEVYSISGDWDYVLHLLVRDMEDLEDFLMRRVLGHASVGGTSTQFVIRRLKHTTVVPVR